MVKQKILNLDKSERIVLEIKRHPIGLWGFYIFGAISTFIILGILFFVTSQNDSFNVEIPQSVYAVSFSLLIAIFVAFTWIGIFVYKENELIVTNENIIQILQFGLFNKQVSQLNLAKIQDVSVDQVGIIQTYFNYGTLEIETAGEAANFKFKYTPNPNTAAKIIIEAHEDFIRTHPDSTKRV